MNKPIIAVFLFAAFLNSAALAGKDNFRTRRKRKSTSVGTRQI
jgi:hypothetical protein